MKRVYVPHEGKFRDIRSGQISEYHDRHDMPIVYNPEHILMCFDYQVDVKEEYGLETDIYDVRQIAYTGGPNAFGGYFWNEYKMIGINTMFIEVMGFDAYKPIIRHELAHAECMTKGLDTFDHTPDHNAMLEHLDAYENGSPETVSTYEMFQRKMEERLK